MSRSGDAADPDAPSTALFRDPVCGMEGPLAKSAGHTLYRGTRYDFCSRECRMKFEAGPAPFVDPPEVA